MSENNENKTTEISTANPTTDTIKFVEKKKRNKGRFVFKQYHINQELNIGQKVGTDALLIAGYTSISRWKPYNLLETTDNENNKNIQLNSLVFGEKSNTPYDFKLGNQYDTIINYDEEDQDNIWPKYILDIGTGTNVLSIMFGQRFKKSIINSIDIDESAIAQSKINIDTIYKQGKSITDRNYLFHTPIQDFKPNNFIENDGSHYKKHVHGVELEKNEITIPLLGDRSYTPSVDGLYDLIVCAPPYFPTDPINDPQVVSMEKNRRIARHTHTLTMYDLLESVKRLLRPDTGLFTTIVSVPDPAIDLELAACQLGFICLEVVDVSDTPTTKVIRKMYTFKLPTDSLIVIQENNKKVTKKSKIIVSESLSFKHTVYSILPIYETGIKDSNLRVHRKHSDQYKWMLNDFCDHFLKEEFNKLN